ncbi:DNRLRE domain-containing protein [Croceimicrobium sp.]|uniref:DNRLRE domain-containing protein n=1 Tax=Croceimicrobium sp. TaxID=2828340 RepID=UPI003BA905EF
MKHLLPIMFLIPLSLFSQSFSADKDAWIWSMPAARNINFGKPNAQNSGLHNVLRAESWQWQANRDDTIRFLIHFPIDTIPVQDIDSAFLYLNFYANPNFTKQVGRNAFRIHFITEAWQETQVTWANQPAFDNLLYVEGATSQNDTQSYRLDITQLLKSPNQQQATGFLIKLSTEIPFAGLSFASREHSQPSLHPKLVVHGPSGIGIKEINESKIEFNNPIQEELQLKATGGVPKEILILDSQGRKVYQGTLDNTLNINTSEWAIGRYYMWINGEQHALVKL